MEARVLGPRPSSAARPRRPLLPPSPAHGSPPAPLGGGSVPLPSPAGPSPAGCAPRRSSPNQDRRDPPRPAWAASRGPGAAGGPLGRKRASHASSTPLSPSSLSLPFSPQASYPGPPVPTWTPPPSAGAPTGFPPPPPPRRAAPATAPPPPRPLRPPTEPTLGSDGGPLLPRSLSLSLSLSLSPPTLLKGHTLPQVWGLTPNRHGDAHHRLLPVALLEPRPAPTAPPG